MSRTEVFEASGPSSGTKQHPSSFGATKDGRLIAAEAHLTYEVGYPGSPVSPACQCMMAPYDIPNAWIEALTWW